MEEFNLDLGLDEATEARIAHADFLNAIKDWGMKMGVVLAPFAQIGQGLEDDQFDDEFKHHILDTLPIGISVLVDCINDLYNLIQTEAVKVLGAPFAIHKKHSDTCGQPDGHCGHQDHWDK